MIALAREEIAHRGDGPLTPFVLICRACRLAAEGSRPGQNGRSEPTLDEIAAEALHDELVAHGWVSTSEDAKIVTGS
jgi:hypothetical protein